MDTFDALPGDKQERVINAAMGVFAAHGYRKASVADIAKAAGISKAMVFTYFGSKAGLYEYLSRLVMRVTLGTFEEARRELMAVTDYFERISRSMRLKISMMDACPSILAFSASMFVERDEAVRPMIEWLWGGAFALRDDMLLIGIDEGKFKDPADVARIAKMTDWMATGAAEQWNGADANELDACMSLFDDCLAALKAYYYKGEYL